MSSVALKEALEAAVQSLGLPARPISLERPRDPAHGDVATNLALTLSKELKKPPREIAADLAGLLNGTDGVEAIEIAGPGFLNFRLAAASVASFLHDVLEKDQAFGDSDVGAGARVMVEFVSANPTGPLHLGHGRQAALGDGIASLLTHTGWSVHREFYFNDAGRQMERLAESVWVRYQQTLGQDTPLPEDGYQGTYIVDLAQGFRDEEGDGFLGDKSDEVLSAMRAFAVKALKAEQVKDLDGFGVRFDEFFPETSLYSEGRVDQTVAALKETGLTYEEGGALWLKTTEFGDQKDRVMIKSDGSATYFLPDVAYHMGKWERGFHHVINVQGSDHHSTVDRVRAGLQALGRPEGYPEYVLHQMVTVEQGGKEVKFSKRAGSYTTMAELVEMVGVDVARWFFMMRRPEAHLSIDLDVALDQSDKNPVFKVQYAHARMCSILRKSKGLESSVDSPDVGLLSATEELELLKQLAEYPETVSRAARTRAPHVLCDCLEKTAGKVNSWYHAGNPSRNPALAVLSEDPDLRAARLALTDATRIILRNGLSLLGINAPERMERSSSEA